MLLLGVSLFLLCCRTAVSPQTPPPPDAEFVRKHGQSNVSASGRSFAAAAADPSAVARALEQVRPATAVASSFAVMPGRGMHS